MGELWVPFTQGPDRVLYGDLRFSHDDIGNGEGNLGLGYRQYIDNPFTDGSVILGGSAWFDRRSTDLGSTFHQGVIGAELLGEDWDIRTNAYLPFNRDEKHKTANIGRSTPYLSGNGILYDTNGVLVEEAHPGLDLELGYRVPVFEEHIDSIRVYGGLYHFEGDKSENVSGWRSRIAADITEDIQLGARFQRDDERGSQGFLEATIRFPFGNKQSFRRHGLKARLDESPERDIDIVTASKVTDTGLAKPVLVASGASSGVAQRVLHVDNTAAAGGDGSLERPFHQLKLAEAALADNDVVYIHRGDGTTTGQNQGIVIGKSNVFLIGSGADFVYDNGKFSADKNFTGTIIAPKTSAPVITNTNPATNHLLGNGVLVTADNVALSGLTVNGTTGYGFYGLFDNGESFESFSVSDLLLTNNTASGAGVSVREGATLKTFNMDRVVSNGSPSYGAWIAAGEAGTHGRIETVSVQNYQTSGNNFAGIKVRSANAGSNIDAVNLSNISSKNNLTGNGHGVFVESSVNGRIEKTTLSNIETNMNGGIGTYIYSASNSIIDSVSLDGIVANNNTGNGMHLLANTASRIDTTSLKSIVTSSNLSNGLRLTATGVNSRIGSATLSDIETRSNVGYGLFVLGTLSGVINDVSLNGIETHQNTSYGLAVDAIDGTINQSALSNVHATNNALENVIVYAATNGVVNSSALTNIRTSGGLYGIRFEALSGGNLFNGSLTNSIATGSTYGVGLNDDSTGTLGVNISGGNSLYGNTTADLRLDLDGGVVNAQGNWWGQAGGPLPGRVVNENNAACPGSCGTANTSGALTSAP